MTQYEEERSFLWPAAGTGALGVGAYMGMSKNWKDLLSAATRKRANHLDAIGKIVAEVPKFAEPTYNFDMMTAMQGLETSPAMQDSMKHDIAASAYEAVMHGKKATGHTEAYGAFENIRSAPSIEKAYEMAQREIATRGGNSNMFSQRMSETIFEGGVYNKERAELMAKTTSVYKGQGFATEANMAIAESDLSKAAINEASEIQGRLRGIFAGKGVGLVDPQYFKVGPQEMMKVTIGEPGKRPVSLDFPLRPDVKEMYVGKGLGTRYLTVEGAWDLLDSGKIQKKTFNQFYLDTLQANVSKATGVAGMKRAVKNTIATMQEKAMRWAPPRELLSSGMAAKEAMTGTQMVFAGEYPSAAAIEAAMKGPGAMFPVGSAGQVGGGTLSSVDWRSRLLGSPGELMPFERNPLQALRDWTPADLSHTVAEQGGTYETKGALGEYRSRFAPSLGDKAFKETMGGHAPPRLNAIYMKKGSGYEPFLAEEMGLLSREGADLQKWERIKTEKVRLADGFKLQKEVAAHMEANSPGVRALQMFDKPVPLTVGSGLGMGEDSRYLTVGREKGLTRDLLGYTALDSGEVALHIKETKHLPKGDVGKFFSLGSGMKHTLTRGNPTEFMQEVMGRNIKDADVLLPGERISMEKNPYALATQQVEAMEYFTGKRIDAVRNKLAEATAVGDMQRAAKLQRSLGGMESFMTDPGEFLGLSDDFFSKARANAPKDMDVLARMAQNRIMVGAEKLHLASGNIASEIFGLSDIDIPGMVAKAEELGEETISTRTAGKLQNAIGRSKFVRGRPMMFMGDLVTGLGAGNKASWEPSMFHWLAKAGPGDLGARLAVDVESRLNPSAVTASKAAIEDLTRMQRSFLGEGTGLIDQAMGGFPEAESFAGISRGNMIRETGYWADLGQKVDTYSSNRIYVPGSGAVPGIGSMTTNKGEVIASELENALYDLQFSLKDKSENAAAKIEESAKHLQAIGASQWASSVSLNERAVGTRYLPSQRLPMEVTAGAEETAEALASRTHKLTKGTAAKMFEEMYAAAPDKTVKDFIKGQRKAFEAGERIPGIVGRFPAVGPYSVQPTFFQLIDELQSPGMRGNKALDKVIYAPEAVDKLSISGLKKGFNDVVSVGQGVGQRLDWDMDFQVASFLSNQKTAEDTTKYLVGGAGADYNQYLGRHYMLKQLFKQNEPKAVAAARGEAERLGGAAKHAVGQMTIGRTNIVMDKFRRSVAMEAPEMQKMYEPLLWHMEETATIMAKHGGAQAATRMTDLYEKAAMAIENNDIDAGGKLMTEALEGLGGKENANLTSSFARSGSTSSFEWNPTKLGRGLAETYGAHREDIMAAANLSKASKASYFNGTQEEMRSMMALQQSRYAVDSAQTIAASRAMGEAGMGASIQRLGSNLRSRGSAIASVLKRGKGPMALGAVAAAGIMMMSPATSGSVSANTNTDGPAGGRNLRPEESIPPAGGGVTPPPSGMMISPRTYHQGGTSTRVNMSNTSEDFSGGTYEDAMLQLRSLRGGNMRTRMNVSDDRASLDPNMLADKIYRGM